MIVWFLSFFFISSVCSAETDFAEDFAASWDECAAATISVERDAGIPKGLLTAISKAESGRWDALNKINVAWPWTVTSGAREWYLDSKAEGIAHVKDMLRSGERNIDVGCMQVNLYYHGNAFSSLEAAFDPFTNVIYAASYLEKLKINATDWLIAAGNYHSKTPKYHVQYREKVSKIWRAELRNYAQNSTKLHGGTGLLFLGDEITPIDISRTTELNKAFQRRKNIGAEPFSMRGGSSSSSEISPGAVAMSNWRDAYLMQTGNTDNYAIQAEINRIRKRTDRRNQISELAARHENISADKRASDLDAWRKMYSHAINGPSMSALFATGMQ